MNKVNKDNFKQDKYKYGFVTDIESEKIPKGLNEDIVKLISKKKEEPEWMLEWRLKAFERLQHMRPPKRVKAKFDDIDFQPTPTKDYGDAPARYKSCAEFEYYEDALAIFERAPESVRKRLDRDGDGVPCPGLPHTTDQERYRFKKRAEVT